LTKHYDDMRSEMLTELTGSDTDDD
jgi:hypothetical protein